jgi:hypothetical protein
MDQVKFQFKVVQKVLSILGVSIKNKDSAGDYKVTYKGDRNPDHGYYTNDLEDAYYTGIDMAKRIGTAR